MKKIAIIVTLSTMLLGSISPTIRGIAETTHSSGTINGIENVQGAKNSTQGLNVIDNKSTRPIDNGDGTVEFLGKTWDVIKDYGNGNKMIAMEEKIADSQFNPEWYFNTNDDNSNGYQDSVVKSIVDDWYNTNISGTDYEQYVQPVTLSNPTLGPIKQTYYWKSNDDITGSIGYTSWIRTILAPDKYPTLVGSGEKQAFLMSGSDVTKDATSATLNDAVIKHIEILGNNNISTSWLSTVGGYSNFATDLMSGSTEVRNHRVTEVKSVVPSLVVQTFENGAAVTAKYVDDKGNTISDNVVKSGTIGETYTTEQKVIDGYTFKEVQGNPTGQFTDQEQSITYVYTKNPVAGGSVTAKYVDDKGNTISDNVVKSGTIGETYTTEQKVIDGYTFKEVQGNPTGQFTDQEQTITYVYTKNPVAGGSVTAKYVDDKGNTISDNVVKSGTIGETYTTEQKVIDGYTFKEVQGNPTGQFTDQEQSVTYVYTKNPVAGGSVTAKYVDDKGNTISDNVVKSGTIGETYTTEQKVIDGYTFKEVQGNPTGQFTDQEQTITYVYTKNPVAGGSVTAKYVDDKGNTISDNVVKSGTIGETYTTEQKVIDGYTFKEVQGNPTGQFTDQEQSVTYVYTKNPVAGGSVTAKYVDDKGNTISDNVVKSGTIGETYTTEQKVIDGYTFKEVQGNPTGQFTDQEQTITYVYTKNPVAGGSVTAKYVDDKGNTISDNVVKSGTIGETYTTEQKVIDGYTFKEVQGNPTGQFKDQEQSVTYVYTKNNVIPNPKPDDHSNTTESSKDTNNQTTSNTEGVSTLPQTGENEALSLIGMISGLLLILGTTLMIIFKRKRQD